MGRKQKYETQEDRDEGKRINAWISHHLKDFLLIYFKNCVPANINYDDQTKYLIQAEKTAKQGQALIPTAITDKTAQADIAKYWQEAMEFINSNASASVFAEVTIVISIPVI